MNTLECARAWQAEAAEDGRLSEADTRSFERHAATCDVCCREVQALADLRQAAGQLPVLIRTPLERRRLRNELLRRANELAIRPPSRSRLPLLAATLSLLAAAVIMLWLRVPAPSPASDASPTAGAPTFHLSASLGAQWTTLERTHTLRLSMRSGRFELSVDKLRSGQRFLLELPDGELEVQGTRFIVDVDGKQTRAVRVLEGRVALRLRTRTPLSLGADEQWSPASASTAPANMPSSTSDTATRPTRARIAATPVPSVPGSASDPAKAVPLHSPPRAGSDFASAMAAFSAGDYGRAERLLVEFAQNHPDDSRVEDATFLRAIAHSRRGDASSARAIAREYLRRYPNGLRRMDAERLAR